MKTLPLITVSALAAWLFIASKGASHAAMPTQNVRADYQNLTSTLTTTQQKNPAVVILQGHFKPTASAPSGINAPSLAFTANAATNTLTTATSHGLVTGGSIRLAGATLPAPLLADTDYYVMETASTPTVLSVAATPGGAAIDLTTAGGGAMTLTNQATRLRLAECSFGQPVAQWMPDSGQWAVDRAAELRALLYPPVTATTAVDIENSGAVFRYKTLLYAPTGPGKPIFNNFDNIDQWFGAPERAAAREALEKAREYVAAAPFSKVLRELMLDIIYDLSVAEMQGINKKLAAVAKLRLGFQVVSPFIIDDEVTAYEALVSQMESVLDLYQQLLSEKIDGGEPSDFDSDPRVKGMPMGYYVFFRAQPTRNSTASKYLDAGTGAVKNVPTTGTNPPGPALPPVVERTNDVLFSAYKDYVTLYNILGRYIQYQADLARLLGTRGATGDISRARDITSRMQGPIADDFNRMQGMFLPVTFPKGDASGVNAAIAGVETALTDITNVRGFLNGKTNILGLDPKFLLIVQDPTPDPVNGPRESFDVLRAMLKGPNQPLEIALNRKATALTDFNAYKGSVDRVTGEMENLDSSYAARFLQITGFAVDAPAPGFVDRPKVGSGSELEVAEDTVVSLILRVYKLSDLDKAVGNDLAAANESVIQADSLKSKLLNATETYKGVTRNTYIAMGLTNATAAAAQSVFDSFLAAGQVDSATNVLTAGAVSGGLVAAGVANAAAQGLAAGLAAKYDADLDYAALEFETTLDASDAELTVNQAKQEVGALKREQYAQQLETLDTNSALFQAKAQVTALKAELVTIKADLDGNIESLRSKYYADPIHYLRSENSLILADEAFRNAQRWLFYTQRAAEYKWQQKFSIALSGRTYDDTSIFKLRNATELDELLDALVAWNDVRAAEVGSNTAVSLISLRDHLVAPNPNLLHSDPAKRADPGVRVDNSTDPPVTLTKLEYFRKTLRDAVDANGNLRLTFNTALLEDHTNNFFVGATYFANGSVSQGLYRNKIRSIRGNIITTGATTFSNKQVSLDYGGNTFQRTRRPLPTTRVRINSPTNKLFEGEFTVDPFVLWESPEFNNLFVPRDSRNATCSFAVTAGSAINWTAGGNEFLNTPKSTDFAQLSVAATRWSFNIPANTYDISKIEDVELLIEHQYSPRIAP